MKAVLAVLAGVVVAVVAAAVLGEYGFDGWTVMGAGLLVGLFVAEAMVTVAGDGSRLLAGLAAVLAAGSQLATGWISTGHRLGTVTWKGWAAVALAAAAAAVRARPPAGARRSRPAPASQE